MKTAVSIPDRVVQIADPLAKQQGISRSECFRRAVEFYIASLQYDDIKSALAARYSEEPSGLDGLLTSLQWASLHSEDW